jgi:putative DNA primase/helicase
MDVLEQLAAKAFLLSSASGASLYRFIEKERPTLLLDEYDTYMKGNEVIRGLINAGHKYNGKALKCVGDDHDAKKFECYCPVAMAGIGTRVLNATILSRSHVIKMKPAKAFEVSREFDLDDTETSNSLKMIQSKYARWALDNKDKLKTAKPNPHGSLRNRKKDNWKAFYAIADLAGQKWIDLANNTVEATWQSRSLTFKEILLADIQDIFESHDLEQFSSIELTKKLNALEFRPYAEMNEGNGFTQNGIANILKGYDIKPKQIDFYIDGERKQLRGYKKEWFADAWDRHLTSVNIIPFPAETSAQTVTTSQVNADNGFKHSASVTSLICVTPQNDRKGNVSNGCDTVTPSPSSEGVCNHCKNLQQNICVKGSNTYQATKDGECIDFVYKRQETVINNTLLKNQP